MSETRRRRRRLTDPSRPLGGAWGYERHPYLSGEVPDWFRPVEAPDRGIRTLEDAWLAVEDHAWDALEVTSLWRPNVANRAWEFLKKRFLRSAALRELLARRDMSPETQSVILTEIVSGFTFRVFRATARMPVESLDEGRSRGTKTAHLSRERSAEQRTRRFFSERGYAGLDRQGKDDTAISRISQDIQWREFMDAQCKGSASRPRSPLRRLAEGLEPLLKDLPVKTRDRVIASLALDFRIVRASGPTHGRLERVVATVYDRLKATRRLRRQSGAALAQALGTTAPQSKGTGA